MRDLESDFLVNHLARATMFRRFGRAILTELAETAAYRKFGKNTTVIYQGDTPSYVYVIVRGRVRLSLPLSDGRDFIFSDLGPGDVFDISSLFIAQDSRLNAVSISESHVLQIGVAYVVSLFERHADLGLKVIPVFCQAMLDAQERIIDSTASLPMRLATTLFRIVKDPHGIEVSEHEPQTIRLSQTDLAAMVPASREKVNRCLREWQRRQIIQYDHGFLTILNPDGLKSIALGRRNTIGSGWVPKAPLRQEGLGSRTSP
jgi:CRP/FNR family cyclic AMP-dependent transcriptional regulator